MILIAILAATICLNVGYAFDIDFDDDDNLIPSDGFHDLLGLTPFWLSGHGANPVARSLEAKRNSLPNSASEVLASGSGKKEYALPGYCGIEANVDAQKATLKVKEDSSCVKPSLELVFQKLFPSVKIAESTENYVIPDKFDLKDIQIGSDQEVNVVAHARDNWRMARGDLVVGGAELKLGFNNGKGATTLKDWMIAVTGTIGVSSHSMTMKVNKAKGLQHMPFTWEIASVLMPDLTGLFGITMDYFKFNDVGFDTTKLEGITFNGAEMKGILKADESFQLVAKADVGFSQALKSGVVFLILTKNPGQETKPAIIIDIRDIFNIGEALEVFIKQSAFISDFGMIGRIERDCIIMLAKEDIVMVDNPDVKEAISAFITPYDTKQIPKGVNVRVKVPMKGNMKTKCSDAASLPDDLPDILPITIKISAGGLSFDYPDKFKADLPSMLKCLDPQIAAELPSQLFPRNPNLPITIKEMTIGSKDYAKLTIVLNGPFEFLGGKIKLADLEVSVEWQRGDPIKFSGTTTITVGELAVGITLEKQNDSYSLSAYVESFKLDQLEKMIGPSTLTNFMSYLGSLEGFGIKDFKLTKNFGSGSDSSLRISGVPILWGWDKMSVEGLIWYPEDDEKKAGQPDKAVAVGMVIEGIRLDKLIEKILGPGLFTTAWFSEMTVIVILSNAHGKVEASDEDDSSGANDIGNKDKEMKPDSSDESTKKKAWMHPKNALKSGKDATGLKVKPVNNKRIARDLSLKQPLKPIRQQKAAKISKQQVKTAVKGAAANVTTAWRAITNRRTAPSRAGGKTGDRDSDRDSGRDRDRDRDRNRGEGGRVGGSNEGESEGEKEGEEGAEGEAEEEKAGEEEGEEEEEEDDGDGIKFNIPYLSSQDIEPGLTLIGIFNIPQENGCKGDALCMWLAETVGRDATIEISGNIQKTSFSFGAKFAGTIPLIPGKLNMQSIELKLTLDGLQSSVKLECTMYWSDPEILKTSQLQFSGAIEVSLTGKLSLEFNMIDMWRAPFDFEYLAFGNLHLAIGIAIGVPLPSFEFGGEVWIGKIKPGTNDHAIKVAAYFGIDPNRPSDNYIYASINTLTLNSIFKAFELGSPSVPDFIKDTGFPEGITVAYSSQGKTIDALDIDISPGLYLKGTINFLGYQVSSEIVISEEKFLIDIQLSPIDWAGGLIALRRSEADKKNGPKAFIYITGSSLTVQIEGYAALLGTSGYVYIDVSDTAYKFNLTSKFWNTIEANLYAEAAFGSLSALHFEFSLSVKIDAHLRDIADAVKQYLDQAAETAKREIEAAQRKVEQASQSLANAQRKMDGWKRSIDEYQARLRRRANEIEEAKKKFQNDCKAECGQVCVPFLDWNPQCFKIMWWWVGCPTWNHCRWKVDNVICIAGCEIKKLANKFVAWAEQTGIKIMLGLSEIGKGLIDVGKGFVTMAEKLVDFANSFLEFVKQVVAIGAEILKEMADFIGDIFKLNLFKIHGKLDNEFNACLGLELNCVLFGAKINYKGEFCINLMLIWKFIAGDTVEQKFPGVKKMNNDLSKIEGKAEEFNQDKQDLDKEEQKIESDVKSETTRRRKRDYVPSAKEMYYRKLANERLPPVVTRSAQTIDAMKRSAPWVLIQDFNVRNFDHLPHQDENIPAEKRTLDEDWEKHSSTPCLQVRKVLGKYAMITDGLAATVDSLRNIRENYQATKRSMQQGVESLEDHVRDTEMRHNMTHEEREDLYHWYNEAKDGLKKWDDKASQVLDDQHSVAMATFRSQINHILSKEKNTNFAGYMNELHAVGEAAYKRSNIPSEHVIEAMQELKTIKRDLISMVHDDGQNPLALRSKVRSIRSNINGLSRSIERCK